MTRIASSTIEGCRQILWISMIATVFMTQVSRVFGDDLARLQGMIDSAYAQGKPTVTVPPGVYILTDRKAEGASASLLNLRNMTRGFTVDMRKVTLVVNDRIDIALNIENCANLTVTGATIRRAISPTSQGTVISIAPDKSYVDVKVHKGYPTNFNDQYFPKVPVVDFFEPKSGLLVTGSRDASGLADVSLVGQEILRFRYAHPIPGKLAVGEYAAWRGVVSREVDLINCNNVTVSNVTVQGGAGFAFHEILGGGANRYIHDIVAYPPAPTSATVHPLLSMAADAFHSSCVKTGPILSDCSFTGMDDDPVNIHGVYCLLGKVVDTTTIDADLPWGRVPVQIGDHIDFLDENRAYAGTAIIKTIEPLRQYDYTGRFPTDVPDFAHSTPFWRRITFASPVPPAAKSGWLLGNRDAQGNGFSIRDCTFANTRGRVMIKANGVVAGCKLRNMGGVFQVMPEINCNESGYVTDLLIENNEISNVGMSYLDMSPGAGALTIAQFAPDGSPMFVPRPGGFRNITVRRNTFSGNSGVNVLITSAKAIVLDGNSFTGAMHRQSSPGRNYGVPVNALIYLKHCDGVVFRGNQVVKPGRYMNTKLAMEDSKSVIDADAGISVLAKSP